MTELASKKRPEFRNINAFKDLPTYRLPPAGLVSILHRISGVVMFLLIRKGGMKLSHALVAAIFGFYLASTTLATQINSLDTTIANLIDSVHP